MYRKIVSLLCITLLLSSCSGKKQEQKEDDFVSMDLPQLKAQGEITAVTLYSSTSYFQYKMEPMGYEYDLIKDFARSEGLKLTIKVAENVPRLIISTADGKNSPARYWFSVPTKAIRFLKMSPN